MPEKRSSTPENILEGHSTQVEAIAQKLRKIIKNAIPEAVERAAFRS